jgi:hypothetical protein
MSTGNKAKPETKLSLLLQGNSASKAFAALGWVVRLR